MSKLSVSFTLGKASARKANIEHNNREFISNNVDVSRLADNVTYIRQDIQEAYEDLFGEALREYNEKQTRKDRKIHDYFQHIQDDKRRETHFEIVVQFGDSYNTPVGSENGKLAVKMLDKYMREFQQRNPRLHIVNSTLHADESCPHLHIDFIPFYTQGKEKGLSKGVSLRAALEEQGFTNQNKKQNGMVAWENSEMEVLESILNNHSLERDVKNAKHKNMPVPEYKATQDWKKLPKRKKNMSPREVIAHQLEKSETENSRLKVENDRLITEKHSPYRSFFYSDADKQSFVQSKLDELNIPYRESENSIEAKSCYVERIRLIEKQYVAKPKTHRGILADKLDKVILQSNDFDEVLSKLSNEGYSVKRGKYVAVKPSDDSYNGGFIRLKSVGEDYSEGAIKRRILLHQHFINEADKNINSLAETHRDDSLEVMVQKTIKHYTVVFNYNALPMRKVVQKKPFSWTNCEELDRLARLNKKIKSILT